MKSNILWLRYNIDWFKMANKNCKTCYGRGYVGFVPQSEDEIKENKPKTYIMCDCIANKWDKMTDEERLTFATEKENADELEK